VFVGVSAGAYISALIANGIAPGVLYRNVTRSAGARTDIDDLGLFRINLPEIAGRLVKAPLTILDAAWDYYKNRHETTLTDLVQSLASLLPSGVFLNDGVDEWMATWLDIQAAPTTSGSSGRRFGSSPWISTRENPGPSGRPGATPSRSPGPWPPRAPSRGFTSRSGSTGPTTSTAA